MSCGRVELGRIFFSALGFGSVLGFAVAAGFASVSWGSSLRGGSSLASGRLGSWDGGLSGHDVSFLDGRTAYNTH